MHTPPVHARARALQQFKAAVAKTTDALVEEVQAQQKWGDIYDSQGDILLVYPRSHPFEQIGIDDLDLTPETQAHVRAWLQDNHKPWPSPRGKTPAETAALCRAASNNITAENSGLNLEQYAGVKLSHALRAKLGAAGFVIRRVQHREGKLYIGPKLNWLVRSAYAVRNMRANKKIFVTQH